MDISKKLQSILDGFKEQFGYELKKINSEDDVYIDYLVFERKTLDGNHQNLTIEDHTWEKSRPDFDPKNHVNDIGDWLIFSYLTDDVRDWFGRYTETQYPLTYTEYKIIERIIQQIEKENGQMKGE